MPLVNGSELLLDAQRKGQAIPAFNVENMEFIQGVIHAAERMNYPVILQTTPSAVAYAGLKYFAAMVKSAAESSHVRVALHLDHGNSVELAEQAMRSGYTSVMIDGSQCPFDENVRITKEVVKKAEKYGISVEAELGTVGGKEDLVEAEILYTDPEQAVDFVKQTKVNSLAVAIGTAHGFYKGEPKLNLECLAEIHKRVEVPLVLHGTSGVPYEMVRKCIELGICKVNYATDLRKVFTEAVAENLSLENVDPKKYLKAGRKAVEEAAAERISICSGIR